MRKPELPGGRVKGLLSTQFEDLSLDPSSFDPPQFAVLQAKSSDPIWRDDAATADERQRQPSTRATAMPSLASSAPESGRRLRINVRSPPPVYHRPDAPNAEATSSFGSNSNESSSSSLSDAMMTPSLPSTSTSFRRDGTQSVSPTTMVNASRSGSIQLLDSARHPLTSRNVKKLVGIVKAGLDASYGPTLVQEGLGGTYFLYDASGRPAAVFKPRDEEPSAINNPKSFFSRESSDEEVVCAAGYAASPMASAVSEVAQARLSWVPSASFGSYRHPFDESRLNVLDAVAGGTSGRSGIPLGSAACREVAAYVLDYQGFAGVPPTCLAVVQHENFFDIDEERVLASSPASEWAALTRKKVKLGSLQAFFDHDYDCEELPMASLRALPTREVHKIAVLDLRLFNTDRHGGNILVREWLLWTNGSRTLRRRRYQSGSSEERSSPTDAAGGGRPMAVPRASLASSPLTMIRENRRSGTLTAPLSSLRFQHRKESGAAHDELDVLGERKRMLKSDSAALVLSRTSGYDEYDQVAAALHSDDAEAQKDAVFRLSGLPSDWTPIDEAAGDEVTPVDTSPSRQSLPVSFSDSTEDMSEESIPGSDVYAELIPIDQGYTLPENMSEAWFEWLTWPQAKEPFDDETRDFIAALDWRRDLDVLRVFNTVITKKSARVLRTSTTLLQRGAAAGLTAYEIGNCVCRADLEEPCAIERVAEAASIAHLLDSDDYWRCLEDGIDDLIDAVLEEREPRAFSNHGETHHSPTFFSLDV